MFRVALLLSLLGGSLALSNRLDICENQEDGARLAHPADCSKFIECDNGETVAIRYCPHGLHFNRYEAICDYKFRAGCDYSYALQLLSSDNAGDIDCAVCRAKCTNYGGNSQQRPPPVGQPNEKPKPPTGIKPQQRPSDHLPIVTPCVTKPATPVKPVEPSTPCNTPTAPTPSTPSTPKPSTPVKPVKPSTPCNTPTAPTPSTPSTPKPSTPVDNDEPATPCNTPTGPTPSTPSTPKPSTPCNTPTPSTPFTPSTPKPSTPVNTEEPSTPCNMPTAPTPSPSPKPTTTPCSTIPSTQPTTTPTKTPCASKLSKSSNSYNGRSGVTGQSLQEATNEPASVRLCENPGQCANQKDGTVFKDPLTNGFIVCHNQCEVKMICPRGLVFNPTIKVCDWPKA